MKRTRDRASETWRRLRDRSAATALGWGLRHRADAELVHLGTAYGGWTVPRAIDSSWICYTAGVGEDASFDLALARIGCDVVAIDPTPRAVEYVRPLVDEHPNLRLAPYALWDRDTEVEFFPPADTDHVSFSATNRQRTSRPMRVPARTLDSIAAEIGHRRIDLLKMDIEGAEYPVLETLDLARFSVRVVCVEYHNDHGVATMLRAVRSVLRRGYEVGALTRTDVTFLRTATSECER